jgi:hypothetical protein
MELATPSNLPEAYTKAEKSIDGFIDSCIVDLQQLKVRHNEHINKRMSSHQKFKQLRQKLVNEELQNEAEATGDSVVKMLRRVK